MHVRCICLIPPARCDGLDRAVAPGVRTPHPPRTTRAEQGRGAAFLALRRV